MTTEPTQTAAQRKAVAPVKNNVPKQAQQAKIALINIPRLLSGSSFTGSPHIQNVSHQMKTRDHSQDLSQSRPSAFLLSR